MKKISALSLLLITFLLGCEQNAVDIENSAVQSERLGYIPLQVARQVGSSFLKLADSKDQSARKAAKSIKETRIARLVGFSFR